jgi:hypothetical protein
MFLEKDQENCASLVATMVRHVERKAISQQMHNM